MSGANVTRAVATMDQVHAALANVPGVIGFMVVLDDGNGRGTVTAASKLPREQFERIIAHYLDVSDA